MTTHDEDAELAAAPAPWQPRHFEVVVTVDEAHQAFAHLGDAIAELAGVGELLRKVINAGRDTRLAFTIDEPRPPTRQYATLAEMEAAVTAAAAGIDQRPQLAPRVSGTRRFFTEPSAPPAEDDGTCPPASVLVPEIAEREGVDQREAAHRLLERRSGVLRPEGDVPRPQINAVLPEVRPLVSDATIAEAEAMAERDRAAGGPPWEVADHPDHQLPGGWHHGQLGGVQ